MHCRGSDWQVGHKVKRREPPSVVGDLDLAWSEGGARGF